LRRQSGDTFLFAHHIIFFDLSLLSLIQRLSKPVGALNDERLEQILLRFNQLFEHAGDSDIPPFHYGSHYSNSAVVLFYLFRLEPFAALHVELQGGRFDYSDRLFRCVHACFLGMQAITALSNSQHHFKSGPFHQKIDYIFGTSINDFISCFKKRCRDKCSSSLDYIRLIIWIIPDTAAALCTLSSVRGAWESCLTSLSCFRELVPEFFCLPEFLDNVNHFDFGRTQVWALVSRTHIFALSSAIAKKKI
jgi:hypothetical protein